MIEDEPLNEAPAVAEPDFSRAFQRLASRKTDRYGYIIKDKPMMSDKERRALEKSIEANKDEAQAEVTRLLKMKKTAEIDAMGFSPTDPKKHLDVTIILKRFNLGKPEFVLKNGGKEVIPQPHYNGGVTWVYADAQHKKVVVDALHTISLKEFNMNNEATDQAPQITSEMIRDDMGLGSNDFGKGAMQILRSGWCADCGKHWYAVVFLAKNRVWWGEISAGDKYGATYTNMGKRNLHRLALAKFDAPGKWKNTTGIKYAPVTDSVEAQEDYQTRERDREMANTGQLGSWLDSKEKASKKVYGKGGKVAHRSLRALLKKANWKDEKNRLAEVTQKVSFEEREDGKFEVVSHNGTRSFGVYDSVESATKRIRQIEFYKQNGG